MGSVLDKDCNIGICCFSATHASLMRTSKDRLVQNQDNVSEWIDMPTPGLFVNKLAL
jgi:hypothetical protein